MKNADMPAMPCEVIEVYHVDVSQVPAGLSPADDFTARERKLMSGGMTKREMMAMHFHAAMLSAHNDGEWSGVGCGAAEWAVKEADELLAELERTK